MSKTRKRMLEKINNAHGTLEKIIEKVYASKELRINIDDFRKIREYIRNILADIDALRFFYLPFDLREKEWKCQSVCKTYEIHRWFEALNEVLEKDDWFIYFIKENDLDKAQDALNSMLYKLSS